MKLPTIVKKVIKRNAPIGVVHAYHEINQVLFLNRDYRRKFITLYPTSINLELTNKCNLKCWICPHENLNMKLKEMDFELFKWIISDLKEFPSISQICPVGLGEPFLYSLWKNAFRYIKKKNPAIPLRIVTNGVLVNESVSSVLNTILGKGDEILFSLNVWRKDDYKKLMGSDKFDVVKNNIIGLVKERERTGKDYTIQAQLIITKETKQYRKDFEKFWLQYLTKQNDGPVFRELENWGGKIDTTDKTTKVYPKRYPCLSLWSVAMVDCNGNVFPCCEALSEREKSALVLGNVKDTPLFDLYQSEKYKHLRELHLTKNWDKIEECRYCDFWTSSPNIWKYKSGGYY